MIDTARILRTFLASPHDNSAWLGAWDLVVGQITSYLRAWESRGRRLPLSLFAGENRHRDLAVVVVSELFMVEKASGLFPLIRFLKPHAGKCDEDFTEQYLAIVRKTVRQNVHKLERESSAESWNIRRNIRRALRQSNGEFKDLTDGRYLEWAWTKAKSLDRRALPRVDDATLHAWVTSACREEPHTPAQCRHVLAELDDDDRFRNSLSYFQLVKIFVAVQLDHDVPQEVVPDSPLLVRIRGLIQVASSHAFQETLGNDLPRLAQLAGLDPGETKGVEAAFNVWLADWVEHFDNDSLREYLCEQLGEIPLPVYQKRFHYLWNTLTSKCKDRILMRVRKQIGISSES